MDINKKSKKSKKPHVVIIGAGPAGLACAWWLAKYGKERFNVTVIEKSDKVGGLAKTLIYKGCRFDVGGHRFYTKIPEISDFYSSVIGKNMLIRDRMSRIYYEGNYYSYPLKVVEVLKKIGIEKAIWIVASYIKRQINRHKSEINFTNWVENRFGDALFSMFFRAYTEKVWGIKTEMLSAHWAMQRIQNFSLPVAAINALTLGKLGKAKTVITKFQYPKFGPGQMYEQMQQKIKKMGVKFIFNSTVSSFKHINGNIKAVTVNFGKTKNINSDYVVSTMPLNELILKLNPNEKLKKTVKELKFRHFITVNLLVKDNPFPDNWIYIHDPSVKVGRIQNFVNWSPNMSNKEGLSPITLEYFCNENDDIWNMQDEDLIKLAKKEIKIIKLFDPDNIKDGFVYRVKDAYPIYSIDYEKPLDDAKNYLKEFKNLYTCGRGGMFRYNNMDHSLETGFMVARKILNPSSLDDHWKMSEPVDYLEEK